jgi:hypothetical protein
MEDGPEAVPSDDVPPWFPTGLVVMPATLDSLEAGLPTPWGRLHGWDPKPAFHAAWWSDQADRAWGEWPASVSTVEVVAHHCWGVEVHLDDHLTAHVYPLQTGHEVSTLALHEAWRNALVGTELLLPVGGLKHERGDAVAVFPRHRVSSVESEASASSPTTLAARLGRLHAPLVAHATPNAERRWNERLKAIEDRLKTHTLWRAPHTSDVVGLPSIHPGFVHTDDGASALVPLPRPLVNHLLCQPQRRPGLANAAVLEQQLALLNQFTNLSEREAFYAAWAAEVPPAWSSPSAWSSANGGVWIWRYEAMLLLLAEARAFGMPDQAKRCEAWLRDVSRIQARLGELRTVLAVRKGTMWSALIAGAWSVGGAGAWPLTAVLAAVSLVAHGVYRQRLPAPI